MRGRIIATALALAGVSSLLAGPAAAAQKQNGQVMGYVTAESRYGGQSVSGPVRRGPQGRLEVRLPGGTWMECGTSCSDTLRRQTVDFWRNHGGRPGSVGGDGPGYLQFRW